MTICATLLIYHPVLHQSKARKRMAPLALVHLRDADWYLTISWQLSLLAKENKPELTKTKPTPRFEKIKRSQQILNRDVHWRKNLHVWDCSNKKVRSYMATFSAAWSTRLVTPNETRWIFSVTSVVSNCLFTSDTGTCYQQAKLVLHTAVPDRLPAREKEMNVIRNFLREHICGKKAGSLYLSGAPGTGKTACLSRILQDLEVHGESEIWWSC